MLAYRALHTTVCASCRLRASIAAKQLARRSRNCVLKQPPSRVLSTTRRVLQEVTPANDALVKDETPGRSADDAALQARKTFGEYLPEGQLSEEEYRVYERLYGKPLKFEEQEGVARDSEVGIDEFGTGTELLKEGKDGELEEVLFEREDVAEDEGEEIQEDAFESTDADARLADDIRSSLSSDPDGLEAGEETDEGNLFERVHPLTFAYRFGTFPTTLQLPKPTLVEPIATQLEGLDPKHLSQAAHRVFGGMGLPYSTATPALAKTKQQKPIALDAYQGHMSEREGDVFLAALYPGVYASAMSVLVETRKRLGTAWAEQLVQKAGKDELRILEAGGGGASVLAVRDMLRAEWERMHDASSSLDSGMALAEADGKIGGAGASPPLGHATVLTASDTLRHRASKLLDNTTFVPRLPDYAHTEEAKKKGKFDIILAPHTLWPLRENYLQKAHMQNLWSMLSTDGGVLCVLEKGVPRGFELVAGAREMLLETRIGSHSSIASMEASDVDWESEPPLSNEGQQQEKGMIIAPCTNHESCPMFQPKGVVKGRKDICYFSQRYIRPPFLQKIIGARDKSFEDVEFSYFSVMRGKDLRDDKVVLQNEEATDRAFDGFEDVRQPEDVHGLMLPRAVLAPLKRRGHVILDLCTPAGTLERWTVPRSFSKQAYRDARKSRWGDLWALGAKTRVPRVPKINNRASERNAKNALRSEEQTEGSELEVGVEADGQIDGEGDRPVPEPRGEGGRMRTGRRVPKIRDKRDKKATGNGRRKQQIQEDDV